MNRSEILDTAKEYVTRDRASVFLLQYDFTGQTYDELKAERQAA